MRRHWRWLRVIHADMSLRSARITDLHISKPPVSLRVLVSAVDADINDAGMQCVSVTD